MKRGFTLIEMLIVVLIIGILAAIALPQYQFATLKSKYSNMLDLGNSIVSAEHRYYMATGSYTNDFRNLDISLEGCTMDGTFSNCSFSWGACYVQSSYGGCYLRTRIYYFFMPWTKRYCLFPEADEQGKKLCQELTAKSGDPSSGFGGDLRGYAF